MADMENKLKKFTASLIPSDDFIKHGLALITKVENVLKTHSAFKIDRVIHAGSLGKGTEVLTPDVDAVVFLNDKYAPFEDVLKEWERLLGDKRYGLNVEKMKPTGISLQFGFADSGVKVDLLPATNFLKGMNQGGGGDALALALSQQEAALKYITEKNQRPECQSWYAGSLSEAQVQHMKAQSAFTHELVRIGKYWYKTLYLGPKNIYGMKLMLEVIAVNASNKMKDKPQPLTTAFLEFLTQVSQIDGLSSLMDPANKYNNLALNMKDRDEEVKNLKRFAAETKNKLANNNADLLGVFQATPPKLPATISFLLGFTNTQSPKSKFNQGMVTHYQEKGKKLQDTDIHAIEVFLVATVNSAAASLAVKGQAVALKAVEDVVRNAMDAGLQLKASGKWMNPNSKHEDCDITFVIPVTKHEDLGAMQVSLRMQ